MYLYIWGFLLLMNTLNHYVQIPRHSSSCCHFPRIGRTFHGQSKQSWLMVYNLGKEEIFYYLEKHFKTWIVVSVKKYEMLELVGFDMQIIEYSVRHHNIVLLFISWYRNNKTIQPGLVFSSVPCFEDRLFCWYSPIFGRLHYLSFWTEWSTE